MNEKFKLRGILFIIIFQVLLVSLLLVGSLFAEDFVFFDDNPTTEYCDASWGYANDPSYLELVVDKFPVVDSLSYSGENCLKLHWRSESGGDWAVAIAEPGWPGHDLSLVDTLEFYCTPDSQISPMQMPFIYFEDLSNQKSDKISLGKYCSDLNPNNWTKIEIPIADFQSEPGEADFSCVKTIFFSQDSTDTVEHTLFLDDIKMTGDVVQDSLLTGKTNEENVLIYLKSIQDYFSDDGYLVPAMEDVLGHTFNNVVTAMAFILEGEKARAERILDFYANRMDANNTELNNQNFYYNGESRGFFQKIRLVSDNNPVYSAYLSDRWMGDMAWLVLALKYYEKCYGFDDKPLYSDLVQVIRNLLIEFYYEDPDGYGGFIRHGWRWGPLELREKSSLTSEEGALLCNDVYLHEMDSNGDYFGHEEGNIDCYAVMRLCGEDSIAAQIKTWLDHRMDELAGYDLPLDLYSWRSMAFRNDGDYYKELAMIPENNSKFRKNVNFNGRNVVGFYSSANANVDNIWSDGHGHMICAFYSSDYSDLGDFYNNQFDSLLIFRSIGNEHGLAIPYAANSTGDYTWVSTKLGFSSSCAWYLFAKKGFNPFTMECYKEANTSSISHANVNSEFKLNQNYPNPFNNKTTISFNLQKNSKVSLVIFDMKGETVRKLINNQYYQGSNTLYWDGCNYLGIPVASGIYFYQLLMDMKIETRKMIFLH